MPQTPAPRYYDSRGAYYVKLRKVQYMLAKGPKDGPDGPVYRAAVKEFARLTELDSVEVKQGNAMLGTVLEAWLQDMAGRWAYNTLRNRQRHAQALDKGLGRVPLGRLNLLMIEEFFRHQRGAHSAPTGFGVRSVTWGDGAERACYQALRSCLQWSIRRGLIVKNPLVGFRAPQAKSRGAICLITAEEHRSALATLRGERGRPLREILIALHATGARPCELVAAESRYWDARRLALVYLGDDRRRKGDYRHKTAGSNKDRVIRFTGEGLALITALMERHPTGPLFRTSKNNRWDERALSRQVRVRLRSASGNAHLTPYSYRHQLATDWILAGHSYELVSLFLGTSVEMLCRHYGHPEAREDKLQAILAGFQNGR